MLKDIPNDPASIKARAVLNKLYLALDNWEKVALRVGLENRAQAWAIANGKLRPTPAMLAYLAKKKNLRGPKTFLKKIRRVAIPFLVRQQVAPSRCYLRGGIPFETKG